MPELPEVTTTVNGLNKNVRNLKITEVWSDYHLRTKSKNLETIKNKRFWLFFKKEVVGQKIKLAERRGKNILIHLSGNSTSSKLRETNKTILVHMKMTGHFLYGKYFFKNGKWESDEKFLSDPFNKFIRLIFRLSNGKYLAFSDMRRFAKVTLFESNQMSNHQDLKILGPEANDQKLDWKTLKERLSKKPEWHIKTALMDQTVTAGIGNIYSDEILWASGIHPEKKVKKISDKEIKTILNQTIKILSHSITLGGDSMSDYRNIDGKKGGYQNSHKAYRKTNEKCSKKSCGGIITRKIIDGRSAHFCNIHQKL